MKFFLKYLPLFLIPWCFAQEVKIKQDDDQILIFNESDHTVEVWVRLNKLAFNEVLISGEMKKLKHPKYLTPEDLNASEILYAYSYRALEQDVARSLNQFYKNLEQKRKILNRGYKPVNQPFYRTELLHHFVTAEEDLIRLKQLPPQELNLFISEIILPHSKDLLGKVHQNAQKSKDKLMRDVAHFFATSIHDESENNMFLTEMNRLQTYFDQYSSIHNQRKDLGSLEQNNFKIFTNNPGTDFGVYLTTNNLKLIRDYNYREMDTRGFNFEVYAAQRLFQTRVAKRRTLNYYAAASYLSLKDKEFGLKKSFVNLGPEIRFTGYYENQVQLVAGAGLTTDITAKKYLAPLDKRQLGYYAGGELSLLFIRLGMRYYSGLASEDLMPEGKWFYRLGIVAKF
ncbi:MAG: hypothetical protein Q4G27_09365 [Flavobacteriaceae bacterium]|nr:hypothetical protein [Flavobacteriaceae bacterium]